MGSAVCLQLKIMIWKSYTFRKHHWMLTLIEFLCPLILFGLSGLLITKYKLFGYEEGSSEPKYSKIYSSSELYDRFSPAATTLYYAPKNNFTKQLIGEVQLKVKLTERDIFDFESESDLVTYYNTNGMLQDNVSIIAVVFKNTRNGLQYAIMPGQKFVSWHWVSLFNPEKEKVFDISANEYFTTSFIALQMAIDTSYIEIISKKPLNADVTIQAFPYPPDSKGIDMSNNIPLYGQLLFICFLWLDVTTVQPIVKDKYSGLNELMKMMGLKWWTFWIGWFLHAFILYFYIYIGVTILLTSKIWSKNFALINYCDWSVFFVFILLQLIATIPSLFAVSSFIYTPALAEVLGFLFLYLTQRVPESIITTHTSMKWKHKILFALFPNMALYFGFETISLYERRKTKLNWKRLFQTADGSNSDVTMGHVFLMCLVDAVMYMVITFYIGSVRPGRYGIPKPFMFPLSCILKKIRKKSNKVDSDEMADPQQYSKIEPVSNLKPGIQVKNLYKRYDTILAVNNLSIDIYEEEITVLLGHNGAGKSTTMLIITGMTTASSGKVLINGLDIQDNANAIRESMGLCPQHNLQSDDFTVLEHLIFFAMLKGVPYEDASIEAKKLLRQLNIYDKKDIEASKLSGGMRRKLSLGIALIGNTKVLILDEPTSGLDPEARREIWDILLKFRGSRTIIITTHFMEEADVLGDRIAIMDHGRLMCYGSSMFLKKEYGAGYNLILVCDEKSDATRLQNIQSTIEGKIDGAVLQLSSGNQLVFLLPHEEKLKFGDLFGELENRKKTLGITNISMSVTTLEEVFLRVGSINIKSSETKESANKVVYTPSTAPKATGLSLLLLQLSSLFKKRRDYSDKNRKMLVILIVLMVAITIHVLYKANPETDHSASLTSIALKLKDYGKTNAYYGAAKKDSPDIIKMKNYYHDLVLAEGSKPQEVNTSVSDVIIRKGKENIVFYSTLMVIAAEFNMTDKQVLNAMFSNSAIRGAPISVNLLMNAVLKSIAGNSYSILTTNTPLESLVTSLIVDAISPWPLFTVGMVILAEVFVFFPHRERSTKIKQLQLMCGVSSAMYWLTCFIFDLFLYLVSAAVVMVVISSYCTFGNSIYVGRKQFDALVVILFAYGISVIPFVYLFHYYNTMTAAFSRYMIISLLFVGISYGIEIITKILEMASSTTFYKLLHSVSYILSIFPPFGLNFAIIKFSRKTISNYEYKSLEGLSNLTCLYHPTPCCDDVNSPECIQYLSYFNNSEDAITYPVVIMALSCLLYFFLLLLLESTRLQRGCQILKRTLYQPRKREVHSENDDIMAEMERISETLIQERGSEWDITDHDDLLLVHNLEHSFRRKTVVNGTSFAVKRGDCFGLLGVNGAGKTTTFRILTGDLPLISGEVRIVTPNKKRVYMSKNSKKYLKYVGYCPQFDAINEDLTARQILTLFAELRGMKEGVVEEVNQCMNTLGLHEHADKPSGQYSGGTKRKLSIAMALVAGPPLVMLDEPTSGMDPISRHKLWDTLTALQHQEVRPSIILTSHSMDECEALCNRLAIMKEGQLECCGTIPDLKKQYARGFSVMLRLGSLVPTEASTEESKATTAGVRQKRDIQQAASTSSRDREGQVIPSGKDPVEVKQLMLAFEQMYKGNCKLKDKHVGLLHYHINDTRKKWSQLFKEMEVLKTKYPIIEDYVVSETSLEEVFLSIARGEARTQEQSFRVTPTNGVPEFD